MVVMELLRSVLPLGLAPSGGQLPANRHTARLSIDEASSDF